ncbi:helix-turn-helix domain-containing protein [Vibrio proteolyticus]|uniref:Putative Xre family DNA-binding protein n=1 Tax=Vibrio proteolyticus NBRC 13287 TaxID=1219065 RepID=U3BQQ6_VIBPR|nr:helix-turn-helix transcriptional regulator [Vibrio proteolyticus]GAD68833.1 putative Xre family DNA-binding protein [Vibrio proteolyticus NBRC 13287]
MKTTAFGRYLRKLRIDKGMILKDLADALGVSSAYLSALELGKKNISDEVVNQIIGLYGLNANEANELRDAATVSQPVVKFDLKNANSQERELVAVFARKYQEMSPEKKEKLMDFLEG